MSTPVEFTRNKEVDYPNNVYEDGSRSSYLCSLFLGRTFTIEKWTDTDVSPQFQVKCNTIVANEIPRKTWEKVALFIIAWIATVFTLGILYIAARISYLKYEWVPVKQDNAKYIDLGDCIRNKNSNFHSTISHIKYSKDNPIFTASSHEMAEKERGLNELIDACEIAPHDGISAWIRRLNNPEHDNTVTHRTLNSDESIDYSSNSPKK